jgi:hypothetical protein
VGVAEGSRPEIQTHTVADMLAGVRNASRADSATPLDVSP